MSESPMMHLCDFSPAQCEVGRAYLTWSALTLAYAAGLHVEQVEAYEAGRGALSGRQLNTLNDAFSRQDLCAFTTPSGLEGIAWKRPRLGSLATAMALLTGMSSAIEDRGANAT